MKKIIKPSVSDSTLLTPEEKAAQAAMQQAVAQFVKHMTHIEDCFVAAQMQSLGLDVKDIKNYTLVRQQSEDGRTTRIFLKHKNANWRQYEEKETK